MMISDDIQAWTFDTIVAVVRAAEFEPANYDFKEVLTPERPAANDVNRSIRRTACAMANSGGGYILFGIRDRATPVGNPEERVVGVPLGGDLRKQFGDKLQGIEREIHFEALLKPIALPSDASRGIFVVRVPISPLRPHQEKETGVFYRRGDGGQAIPMDYYEVRDQMLLAEERLRRMTLLRLQLEQFRQQANAIRSNELEGYMHRFDTSSFLGLVADVCSLLPGDSDLLPKLTEISKSASWVNTFLDRAPLPVSAPARPDPFNPFVGKWHLLSIEVAKVQNGCAGCESRLREIFGPLTR